MVVTFRPVERTGRPREDEAFGPVPESNRPPDRFPPRGRGVGPGGDRGGEDPDRETRATPAPDRPDHVHSRKWRGANATGAGVNPDRPGALRPGFLVGPTSVGPVRGVSRIRLKSDL